MFFESNSVFNFGNDTFVPTIPTACGPGGIDRRRSKSIQQD